MATQAWPKISATTLADQVYEALRDRILSGELAPGEFIREQEVGLAMGVSRTPVREALSRLASEGFVERLRHRGFRIPEEAIPHQLELYPIVTALEVMAGRLAFPRLTAADLANLRGINHRIRDAVARDDRVAMIELNNHFHHVLAELSGNRRLCELLDDLRSQLNRLEYWSVAHPEHTEEAIRQHEEIVEAAEKGDFRRAVAILERNRLQTYAEFREEFDSAEQLPVPEST